MKNLLISICCILLASAAYADDVAHLRLQVSGAGQDNTYFLCISNAGCFNLYGGSKRKNFPLEPGMVDNIFTTDVANSRMVVQSLPASCKVMVNPGKTLTVSGKLVVNHSNFYISNLRCLVA